jgi:hypothetical protein
MRSQFTKESKISANWSVQLSIFMQAKHYLIPFLLILSLSVNGQLTRKQQLIEKVMEVTGLFVSWSSPPVRIDRDNFSLYLKRLKERGDTIVNETILESLLISIRNSKDTSRWTDIEMPGKILVSPSKDTTSLTYVFLKFSSSDSSTLEEIENRARLYNKTEREKRPIAYLSRPILDRTNQFAILQLSSSAGMMSGGGWLDIYHYKEGKWNSLGPIIVWRY